jgi:hypothetical protein
MTQRILSIIAMFMALVWVAVFFFKLPSVVRDPDGEGALFAVILLDIIILIIGLIAAIVSRKRSVSLLVTFGILAIPVMHSIGSFSEPPFSVLCFFAPIILLLFIVIIKWNPSE